MRSVTRPGLDAGILSAHLAHGSLMLVLDGMDEVPVSGQSATFQRWSVRGKRGDFEPPPGPSISLGALDRY